MAEPSAAPPLQARAGERLPLHRVLLPVTDEIALRPLYVHADAGVQMPARGSGHLVVPAGGAVSFDTYFNAFPAAHWAAESWLEEVVLRLRATGAGSLRILRSDARGKRTVLGEAALRGEGEEVEVSVPLGSPEGGWLWFELDAETDLVLEEANWYAPPDVVASGGSPQLSVAITTMNRVDDCVRVLADLAADSALAKILYRVYVIDQGSTRIADATGFPAAAAALGERLRLIEQDNIGGSGGFARGMFEASRDGVTEHVVLLDDDVRVEPESLRRLGRFAAHLRRPAVVGGHMLDLHRPTRLHAVVDRIEPRSFMWGGVPRGGVELSAAPLADLPALWTRADATYNGWWMCLLPMAAIQKLGLSLPLFIKWDDAEYGLRASAAGIPTVTLPGAAVWHVSWADKTDSLDWQAFYHARNRLVTALLHSTERGGGRIHRHNLAVDVKHLLMLEYSTAALRFEAYRSVLAGPAALRAELPTRLASMRALAARFPDGRPATGVSPLNREPRPQPRPPLVRLLPLLAGVILRQLFVPPRTPADPPHLAAGEARWWTVPRLDAVLLTDPERRSVRRRQRDRRLLLGGLRQALRYRFLLQRRWPSLAAEWRAAVPELASPESWASTFERSVR